MEISVNTVVGVAEAKVEYWLDRVDTAASMLRIEARKIDVTGFDQVLLIYNRCYRNLLAAQATLDNLPRKGGAK